MAFLIAIAVLAIILLYSWMNMKPKNFPPGPPSLPLVGSVLFLPRTYRYSIMAGQWMDKYGPVVGLLFGSKKAVAVSGAKAVLEVLRRGEFQGRSQTARVKDISFNKNLGLIFADGPYWHELRRFTLRHLKNFGFGKINMDSLIMEEVDHLMKEMISKGIVQVYGLFKIPALNILWRMTSGNRYARDNEELQALLQAVDSNSRSGSQSGRLSDLFPILRRVFPRSSGFVSFVDNFKKLQIFMKRIISEHEQSLDDNNPRDFIDTYLIEMKKQNTSGSIFTEEGLIVTCQDLFVAGEETTSSTLAFCVLYVVLHPHVQNAVQKELDAVVGRNRRPSVEDRHRLHYVNAVIAEVMRINPAVPMTIPHRAVRKTILNGYEIPKDAIVLVNLWSLFHDREHWGDPEVFRPERFLDEDRVFIKDEWMISFGAGARMCLGEVLARDTVFLFFTTLLQEFVFSVPEGDPVPDTLPVSGMIVAPQPFRIKISRRI